ncbi:MAG: caspase family protein [Pseudomonadota bacterium]
MIWIARIVLAIAFTSAISFHAQADKRFAFLVGVGDYPQADMTLDFVDANLDVMSASLTELGYDITRLQNPAALDFAQAMDEFLFRAETDGEIDESPVILIYLTGIVQSEDNKNYLVLGQDGESGRRRSSIAMSSIFSRLEMIDTKASVVIFDASFEAPPMLDVNNRPRTGASRSISGSLSDDLATQGILIAHAQRPMMTADRFVIGEDGASIYTSTLAKEMRAVSNEIWTVFRKTSETVTRATEGAQIPWIEDALLGKLRYFVNPETLISGEEARYALVIGNADYGGASKLSNPENDADLIASALSATGFDVTKVKNASKLEMERGIRTLTDKLLDEEKPTVAFVYYAGHGVQNQGENYLIPIGHNIERASHLSFEAVNANWILKQLDATGVRIKFLVLDACRNDPLPRSLFRSEGGTGLARMDTTIGTVIGYATAPGEVASDGQGQNSPYAAALADMLTTPALTADEMFTEVRTSVALESQGFQVPWNETSLIGSFYFSGDGEN